jgi:hypothetical protein
MMNLKRAVLVVIALLAVAGAYYFYGGHSTPPGQQRLVSFSSGDLTSLKATFNSSRSSVRVLLMLSPT